MEKEVLITLYECDFSVSSFGYHAICEELDIQPDEDTGEYPSLITIRAVAS